MDKKAFEVQFNWIFVLAAGTAILLFFSGIIIKQKDISETTTNAAILKSVESLIASNSAKEDVATSTDLSSSTIEMSCNRISAGKTSRQFSSLILFSPSKITSTKIFALSKDFSIPYKAVNILMMSSPNVKYIIIGNNEIAREINKSIPDKWNKAIYSSMPDIRAEKDTKYRFIFASSEPVFPVSIQGMPDEDVTAVKLQGDTIHGSAAFYSKKGAAWQQAGTSNYLTSSLLIGAVFSGSKENYECSAANAFSRLSLVSGINADRTGKLIASPQITNTACTNIYQSLMQNFNDIKIASETISKTGKVNDAELGKIIPVSQFLEESNQQLKIYSCQLMY